MGGQNDFGVLQNTSSETDPSFKEMEFLGFLLGEEEYAIDIMAVHEITRATEVTRIPRMPEYMSGIITLRGTIIPIFDLGKRLHLDSTMQNGRSRFIVANFDGRVAGIMVDSVTDVVRIRSDEIEPPPCNFARKEGDFIKGIGFYKGRMLILLDYAKALSMDGMGETIIGAI